MQSAQAELTPALESLKKKVDIQLFEEEVENLRSMDPKGAGAAAGGGKGGRRGGMSAVEKTKFNEVVENQERIQAMQKKI